MYLTGLSYVFVDRSTQDSPPFFPIAVYLLLFFFGVTGYTIVAARTQSSSAQMSLGPSSRRVPYMSVIIGLSIAILGWLQIASPTTVSSTHPIDVLVAEGTKQAETWQDQAARSGTLLESVEEYKRRYHRNPPPGFDAWLNYTTDRSNLVIDDYDSMMDDLAPFWGLSPARIRQLTQEVNSDPWNEISEVQIRNGQPKLGPNFLPTHRWMLDGVCSLVEGFSKFLPDMDLAFNLNDEPRVAVPYQDMQRLLDPTIPTVDPKHRWSPNRAKQWETPEDAQPKRLFEDYSRTNVFDQGTLACPPTSRAQKRHNWDPSPLCTSCASPHSFGVFLANWTTSSDPCHQPDLRHLHGFYLSPAAFKPSRQLLPVFSQSKVAGYSDILYPSPWNYLDKVKYDPTETLYPDPPFAQKESTLFWRGATSEGVSRGGTWKGMTRQRFVHLTNNLTTDSHSPTLPILLPDPLNPETYSYQHLPDPISKLHLSLNTSIVNGIARAWDNDGAAEDAEFGFAPPTDFQDHWRYKYLFDTDGAGFSGRFIPFLQSHSLPIRAGIFRSWYDSRLTAWKHFVPVDIRLHGLFSTLVYFTGAPSSDPSVVEGIMKERSEAGEAIAEAGREWAGKVLRKEDMEIYMFRLLLEWGRLTDDARDEIGFVK